MPFDRELWKHLKPQTFQQQSENIVSAPIQYVQNIVVQCASRALKKPAKASAKNALKK